MLNRRLVLRFGTVVFVLSSAYFFGMDRGLYSSLAEKDNQQESSSGDSGTAESSPRESLDGKDCERVTLGHVVQHADPLVQLAKSLKEIKSPYDIQRLNRRLTDEGMLPLLMNPISRSIECFENAEKIHKSVSAVIGLLGEKLVNMAAFKVKSLYIEIDTTLYEACNKRGPCALTAETEKQLVKLQNSCDDLMSRLDPKSKTQRRVDAS